MNDDVLVPPTNLRSGFSRYLVYFGVALLVPAVSIVLHELGHFGAHAAFGYDHNVLSYQGVSTGNPPSGVDPRLADGLSFAAGTGVSLALLGVGVLSVVALGPNPVGLGLVFFECVRAAIGFGSAAANAGWTATLAGRFGELRYLATALDGPAFLGGALAWVELALPFAAVAFVGRRLERGTRLYASAATLGGLVAGIALWLLVVGPRLLPG